MKTIRINHLWIGQFTTRVILGFFWMCHCPKKNWQVKMLVVPMVETYRTFVEGFFEADFI